MSDDTVTSFFIEHGRTHYGPFETAEAANNYGNRQLKLGLELALGVATIQEYQGRLLREEEITEEDLKRLYREGILQPDGSVLFQVTAEREQ